MASKQITEDNNFKFYSPQNILAIQEQFKTKEIPDTDKELISTIKDKLGIPHPFNYEDAEGLAKKFGLVNSVITKYCDFTIGPQITIDSDEEEVMELLNKWIIDTNFRQNLYPWLFNAFLYGAGYLEIADLRKPGTVNQIKVVDSKTIYAKKDNYGNIISYVQHIGATLTRNIGAEEILNLNKDDIIQFNINKIGTSPYGYGIVYPAMQVINDFLLAQFSIHKLSKRKANTPVHWKMGNVEKDIWPKQGDIDAWGKKLVFMNESTDYVTGPDMEAKVIDYGNLGDKFTSLLENDYQLLSYCFQIPEPLMGKGNVPEGLSNVQMDGFNRRIKAIQNELSSVIKKQIFDVILEREGIDEKEYSVIWGELSDEEENKKLEVYKNLLSSNISPGLRKEIEKKVALIMDIEFEEVEEVNSEEEEKEKEDKDNQFKQQQDLMKMKGRETLENITNEIQSAPKIITEEIKGVYNKEVHLDESIINENVKVSEWLNIDTTPYIQETLNVIRTDRFKDLRAENKREEKRGYLKENDINKLRSIFSIAITQNLSIKDIKELLRNNTNIGDLYKYNKVVLNREKRIDMIAKTELTRLLNYSLIHSNRKITEEAVVKWDATIDEKTCPICAELNNKVFNWADLSYEDSPPIHPNCRCSLNFVKIQGETKKSTHKENILDIVHKNPAPQELEAALLKNGVDETKAKKITERFEELNNG